MRQVGILGQEAIHGSEMDRKVSRTVRSAIAIVPVSDMMGDEVEWKAQRAAQVMS